MKRIVFFDTEVSRNKISDIGLISTDNIQLHTDSISEFIELIKNYEFIGGHNIFLHDIKFLKKNGIDILQEKKVIDTLFLSPLLFPKKPYHRLIKDYKLISDEISNPLQDAKKSMELFFDELKAFEKLNKKLKIIFYNLLRNQSEFKDFFLYLNFEAQTISDLSSFIHDYFYGKICENSYLDDIIKKYPKELAYVLALINADDKESVTPPWLAVNFSEVENIIYKLRNTRCEANCVYCRDHLNVYKSLNVFFGYKSFRTFDGEPLQEKAVKAAIDNKSFLVIFPTGGGKSLTFQLPALMAGENVNGLTVVISPLQSLMKDQVDNLERKNITTAVTINGMLDPIERSKAFERIEDGTANLLYLSPEALRSKSIEHLLLKRNIVRFVIDEAHCLSAWGHDFRVDYLFIADSIKRILNKKINKKPIPVSCFTATAKTQVIDDIKKYFKEKLNLELEIYRASTRRHNLHYKVFEKSDEKEKYNFLRNLISEKNCPTIVYVSRTFRAEKLAKKLTDDGYISKPYHGKLDKKTKKQTQNAFIKGDIDIIVATSAFGMGVDKKDVGMVVHYEISDSLENYIQEAGRAGRDENLEADCYVLYNEEDLNKHFILLNQTKISRKEINQIWKAIKDITKYKKTVSQSALDIARKAGWNDTIDEIETRVKTAIAALEDSGYVHRGLNSPRIFATSILVRNADEAIKKINASGLFTEKEKTNAIRIIKKLIAARSRKNAIDEEAESRIDYISDHLGIVKEEVISIVNKLKEAKILGDTKDLTALILKKDNTNKSLLILQSYIEIEKRLLKRIENKKIYNIKDLNDKIIQEILVASIDKIITILNFWSIKNYIKIKKQKFSNDYFYVQFRNSKNDLQNNLERRKSLSEFIIKYLFEKVKKEKNNGKDKIIVEFSVIELKNEFNKYHKTQVSPADIEDTLFYLSKIEALRIEGGFLVIYNKMTISRLKNDFRIQYKINDYKKLALFYENKIRQIHIVGEYAKKMLRNYKEALRFVDDYFQMEYSDFIKKYFPKEKRQFLIKSITDNKFKEIFGTLSLEQQKIINDKDSEIIVVAAGPGSGKTRVLVHKLASLLLLEDVKHEQLLMLTFSRQAAIEFKKRLLKLVGNAANFVDIKTFHSFCFDVEGRIGKIERVDDIVKETTQKILNDEVEKSRITKTVLVIDEAQDMSKDEFELIRALYQKNPGLRIIAVGDDDQNIYSFRKSNSIYLKKLADAKTAKKYELVTNFRSKNNLVEFSNLFLQCFKSRMKQNNIIAANKENGKILIVQYQTKNLINPVVDFVKNHKLKGTTCILTRKNDDAEKLLGALLDKDVNALLIQSNNGFRLSKLVELHDFYNSFDKNSPTISNDEWKKAKKMLYDTYSNSINYEFCKTLIVTFEETHPKTKYLSDLYDVLYESKIEDFYSIDDETVYVSTMHKAKGKEFDNVILMLDNYNLLDEEEKRLLYVAITRAKNNLIIHYNSDFFEKYKVENLYYVKDNRIYEDPDSIMVYLSFKDVVLDQFKFYQKIINNLKAGDALKASVEGLFIGEKRIVRYSKKFKQKLDNLIQNNYDIHEAKVNFMVYWYSQDDEKEFKIVLPKIKFIKK